MPMKRNPRAPYWLAIAQKEREIIDGALAATGGNVTRAASALGIDRTYLTKLIKRLEIDRTDYKEKMVTP